MAESTEKRSRYCGRRQFRRAACQCLMFPSVLHSAQEKRKTAATMGETNAQRLRQAVEGAAQHKSRHGKLRLGWHGDCPGHHVLRHALGRHHVPGMHQHRRAFIGTVMQKGDNAGIVEILCSHMVADLHTDMSGLHASRNFCARRVDVL